MNVMICSFFLIAVSKSKDEIKPSDEKKKTKELPSKETQESMKVESKVNNPSSLIDEVEPNVEYSVEQNDDIEEESPVRSREGDLRAELSRRRAERLTKVFFSLLFIRLYSLNVCLSLSFN